MIPTESKTDFDLRKAYTQTIEAILSGEFLTWKHPQQEIALSLRSSIGRSPLDWLAQNGDFYRVPQDLLTESALLNPDPDGWTPTHWAAERGHLNLLPPGALTEKTLLAPNKAKNTPLHVAARYGHLTQIPTPLLTEKNLLLPGTSKNLTPLQICALWGHLDQVPVQTLTPQNLLSTPIDNFTPLIAAANLHHLYKLEQKLTISTLNHIRKQLSSIKPIKNNASLTKNLQILKIWVEQEIKTAGRDSIKGTLKKSNHIDL